MSALEITARHRVHAGALCYARHDSAATGTPMKLSVFLPPGEGPFPYVIWLSGLTCTEENFTAKAGAYGVASRLGLAIVAPDTSPRGEDVADDPAYDLGQGAGFYVDATGQLWMSTGRHGMVLKMGWDGKVQGWFGKHGDVRDSHDVGEGHYMAVSRDQKMIFMSDSVLAKVHRIEHN